MGCCHNNALDLEISLRSQAPSKNQVFADNPGLSEIRNPMMLKEETLLGDDAVVELYTEKNDIVSKDRDKLKKLSRRISRHAVKKLVFTDDPPVEKLLIDSKIIEKAIKSV